MNPFLKTIFVASIGVVPMIASASKVHIYFPKFDINLDPQTMVDARSMQVNLQIHRGLFRFLPNGQIKPDLASEWFFSEDHKTLTVKLKTAFFSDGTPITSKHVVYSFARIFAIESSMSADLSGIVRSSTIKQKMDLKDFGITSIDETTVLFRFKKANSNFIQQLATVDCAILPITQISQVFAKTIQNSEAGAGPYRVIIKTDEQIILKKWRKDDLDSVKPPDEIQIMLTNETKIKSLLSIKTDSLDQAVLTAEEKKTLKSQGWTEFVTDMTREHFLVLNPNRLDSDFRKNIFQSINTKQIALEMGSGFSPAFGIIPPVMGGSLKEPKNRQPFGSKNRNKNKESLIILMPDAWEHGESLRKSLSSALAEINVKVTFKILSPQDWNKAKLNKDYDALVNARGVDYPDGISILNYFKSGIDGNYYFISDKKIDRMLNLASQEFNQEKKFEKYKEIQKAILTKHIIVPLAFGSQASGFWGPRVKYVPPHPLGYHFLPFEMIEMR